MRRDRLAAGGRLVGARPRNGGCAGGAGVRIRATRLGRDCLVYGPWQSALPPRDGETGDALFRGFQPSADGSAPCALPPCAVPAGPFRLGRYRAFLMAVAGTHWNPNGSRTPAVRSPYGWSVGGHKDVAPAAIAR